MNKIHPTAIIEGDVEFGIGNEVGPYSVLYGPLKIGDNNYIGPHVTIGTPGQDTRNPRYDSSQSRIEIGNNNIIREYTAIQKPCYRDVTSIGNNVFLMQSVHVPHDAVLEDGVVVTPMVVMGGIVHVLEGANLAVGCSVHQYSVIGQYSIVGMGAALTKNLRPFAKLVPGKPISVNTYAIKKYGFEEVQDQIERYVLEGIVPTDGRLIQIVNHFEAVHAASGRYLY
ncbi:UDP-N-acetylglucosamine acyltransferase [Vogesella urethralis]|uniref:UDP-N-acetylglucosamine acyltransferase n=1 Tax=Vogesella urethralis TaxID=2592656 RepID=UPI00118642B4|nr:UDP-N-acetylglucosamine acyltransferase [Vogesella urethralis]